MATTLVRIHSGQDKLPWAVCPCCGGDIELMQRGGASCNTGYAWCKGECRSGWALGFVADDWAAAQRWNAKADQIRVALVAHATLYVPAASPADTPAQQAHAALAIDMLADARVNVIGAVASTNLSPVVCPERYLGNVIVQGYTWVTVPEKPQVPKRVSTSEVHKRRQHVQAITAANCPCCNGDVTLIDCGDVGSKLLVTAQCVGLCGRSWTLTGQSEMWFACQRWNCKAAVLQMCIAAHQLITLSADADQRYAPVAQDIRRSIRERLIAESSDKVVIPVGMQRFLDGERKRAASFRPQLQVAAETSAVEAAPVKIAAATKPRRRKATK